MHKRSFVFYESFLDAMEEMDGDTAKATLFAIGRYALYGEEPADLHGWARSAFVMARPQIDANNVRYEKSLSGGRPQAKLPPREELDAMRDELGGWDAVAAELHVARATVLRRVKQHEQAPVETVSKQSQNPSQISKPKVNVNENVNENEEEREGAQGAPAAAQALLPLPVSENSVLFPQEAAAKEKPPQAGKRARASPFVPPSVEEAAAFCKDRGNSVDAEAFVSFYASKGWMVGKNKMKDWKQAIITWEKRGRERGREVAQKPYGARASPEPVAVQREESGWHSARTVL